ncbi:hypothetical protein M2317_001883 [Microbacterium sp. ZKA21]|uniref:hypothetical protein n=1 Tax=Microbacterium sp. ZKA21 TaxID=3381694 RepID=UPI003D194BB7
MTDGASERARLAAARTARRERAGRPTRADAAYLVYVGILVAAIAGVPVVRTIVLALATPEAVEALTRPALAHIIGVLGALLWLGALALGRVRGPIVPTPFTASVVGRSDISPTRAWARRLTRATVSTVILSGGFALLAVSGLLANGIAVGRCVAFAAGAALFAVPAVGIWLAGQSLGRRGRGLLAAALIAQLIAVVADVPWTAASALGALWSGSDAAAALLVLGGLAIVAAALLPVLLGRLRPDSLEAHATRWEAMTVLAATGDLAGAADRTRPLPTSGRRLRIAMNRPLLLAVLQRDAIGSVRTPMRFAVALVALAASGAGWAWLAGVGTGPRWVAAISLGVIAYLALGALMDGCREAADAAGRPALYGGSAGRMLLLHLSWPALCAIVVPAAAAWGAGGDVMTPVAVLGALLVAVRAYDTTKGPLPIELMMPVPTPAGDASAIGIWLWQSDALLWTAALAFGALVAMSAGPLALLASAPVVIALGALTVGRLRRAAG